MYRRDVFDTIGTFDPRFDACEDVEFNWRCADAGMTCWTSPALAIAYEPRKTLRGLFRQMQRYGLGRARLHRKHPRAFSLESLIPLGFVVGIPIAIAALIWLPSPWRWVATAPYALYALLVAVASIGAAKRHGWSLLPRIPWVFPTIHAGLGWGYLKGWLTSLPRAPSLPPEGGDT